MQNIYLLNYLPNYTSDIIYWEMLVTQLYMPSYLMFNYLMTTDIILTLLVSIKVVHTQHIQQADTHNNPHLLSHQP